MSTLRVTLIDVGWGDSLLLESIDNAGNEHYALIDSNDTKNNRSSYIYLKRFFERKGIRFPTTTHLFDWVLLSHAHADHGQGLKAILRDFRTQQFWYPKSNKNPVFYTDLIRYANRSTRVAHHQAIDNTKNFPNFGDVAMAALWPNHNQISSNENNNSVVLTLTLGNVCFVLTADAEADVWAQISAQIPANTRFFKVPHHGSEDGVFHNHQTPWLTRLNGQAELAISSHIRPFSHPDQEVIDELNNRGETYYRTDEHYHIIVETDGNTISVQYSHV